MFNDGNYYARAKKNEFDVQVTKDGHPAPAKSGHPKCTRSQTVAYFDWDTGEKIALLHQYRMPSGLIGGSGQPDPKSLLVDGIIYELDAP